MCRRNTSIHDLPWGLLVNEGLKLEDPEAGGCVETAGNPGHTNTWEALRAAVYLQQLLHHSNIIRVIPLTRPYFVKHIHDHGHSVVRGI